MSNKCPNVNPYCYNNQQLTTKFSGGTKMLFFYLLILSICMGTILLSIHNRDEIHKLMAWLSALLALVCVFVLTPPLIKGLLGLLIFGIGHKIFPAHKSFR